MAGIAATTSNRARARNIVKTIATAAGAAALSGTALAQAPDKVVNPSSIPANVRPGAIEAQYNLEVAPDAAITPSIISPFELDQPANAREITFTLNAVSLEGAQAIPESDLRSIYAAKIGEIVSLSEVFGFARAITKKYVERGYPLSLAYVPAQEIDGGEVRIRIVEGFIGEVTVEGAPRGARKRLRKLGEEIAADRPLRQSTLERYLLLANEIPGLSVTGVLSRGDTPEAGVKLTLAAERKAVSVSANLNNRASRAVGREQFIGRIAANNVLTGVDTIGLSAIKSIKADELTVFAGRYSTVLSSEGLSLNLGATRSDAAPGVPFLRDLGFETEGWTASAGLSYPLILSRKVKLGVSGAVNWKEFRSAFGVTPNTLDRLWTTDFAATLSVKDGLQGANTINLVLSKGWDIFDVTRAGSPLASRAGAGGEFVTFGAEISRLQKLTDWADLTLAVQAQTANRQLLSSEQCGFGGAGFGRGFDPFEIAGDRCIVGLAELRTNPRFLDFGAMKLTPFVSFDAGAVRQIGPLVAGEDRNASLYSFGGGMRAAIAKHVFASAEVGVPLNGVVAQEGDDDPRFFFSIEARY